MAAFGRHPEACFEVVPLKERVVSPWPGPSSLSSAFRCRHRPNPAMEPAQLRHLEHAQVYRILVFCKPEGRAAGDIRATSDKWPLIGAESKPRDKGRPGGTLARGLLRGLAWAVSFAGPAAAWAGRRAWELSFVSCRVWALRNRTAQRGRRGPGRGIPAKASSRPHGGSPAQDEGSPPADKDKDKDAAAPSVFTGGARTGLRSRPRPKWPRSGHPEGSLEAEPLKDLILCSLSVGARPISGGATKDPGHASLGAKRAPGGSPAAPILSRALRLGPIRPPYRTWPASSPPPGFALTEDEIFCLNWPG